MRSMRLCWSLSAAAATTLFVVLGLSGSAQADIVSPIYNRTVRRQVTTAAKGWLAEAWNRQHPSSTPISPERIKVTRALQLNLNFFGPFLDTGVKPIPARYNNDALYEKNGGFQLSFRLGAGPQAVKGYVMFKDSAVGGAMNPFTGPGAAIIVRDGKTEKQLPPMRRQLLAPRGSPQ